MTNILISASAYKVALKGHNSVGIRQRIKSGVASLGSLRFEEHLHSYWRQLYCLSTGLSVRESVFPCLCVSVDLYPSVCCVYLCLCILEENPIFRLDGGELDFQKSLQLHLRIPRRLLPNGAVPGTTETCLQHNILCILLHLPGLHLSCVSDWIIPNLQWKVTLST